MLAGLHVTALLAEVCGLFAIWNWSCRSAGAGWLLSGGAILALLFGTVFLLPDVDGSSFFLAAAGVYLFSGLLWAWCFADLHPTDWQSGEVTVALLGTAMVVAAGAAGQS